MHSITRPPPGAPAATPPQPSLVEAVGSAIHGSLKNMIAAESALLDFAESLLTDRMQNGLQEFVKLLPEWTRPLERLPFNSPAAASGSSAGRKSA
jgi:hypothetical protein